MTHIFPVCLHPQTKTIMFSMWEKKLHFVVSGHFKIPTYLPVLKQGFCHVRGGTSEILSWHERQDGVGRGAEGLAKGFGTRRQCVLCQTAGAPSCLLPFPKVQGCSLPGPHHSGHGSKKREEVRITVIQCFGPGLGMPGGRVRVG